MKNKLDIGNWMKREVVTVHASTSIKEAATLLVDKRVGTLPVLDERENLVGVLSVSDIVKIFQPGFVSLLEDFDFVKDFGAVETPSEEDLERAETLSVADIMEPPVAVEEDCSPIRALSVMEKHELSDLPVVKDEKLVGIASWVDIWSARPSTSFLDWQPWRRCIVTPTRSCRTVWRTQNFYRPRPTSVTCTGMWPAWWSGCAGPSRIARSWAGIVCAGASRGSIGTT